MYVGDAFSNEAFLSSYLHQEVEGIRPFVEQWMSKAGGQGEDDLIASILSKAFLNPICIDFDAVAKEAKPIKITINDFGRHVEVDGVRATRSFPFSGDAQLFGLRPSRHSSVLPYGIVSGGTVTIGIEDRIQPEVREPQKAHHQAKC